MNEKLRCIGNLVRTVPMTDEENTKVTKAVNSLYEMVKGIYIDNGMDEIDKENAVDGTAYARRVGAVKRDRGRILFTHMLETILELLHDYVDCTPDELFKIMHFAQAIKHRAEELHRKPGLCKMIDDLKAMINGSGGPSDIVPTLLSPERLGIAELVRINNQQTERRVENLKEIARETRRGVFEDETAIYKDVNPQNIAKPIVVDRLYPHQQAMIQEVVKRGKGIVVDRDTGKTKAQMDWEPRSDPSGQSPWEGGPITADHAQAVNQVFGRFYGNPPKAGDPVLGTDGVESSADQSAPGQDAEDLLPDEPTILDAGSGRGSSLSDG